MVSPGGAERSTRLLALTRRASHRLWTSARTEVRASGGGGSRSEAPICVDGVGPSVFDASRDVGYLSYDSDKDLDSEASRLAEVIVKRVDADDTSGLDVP